MKILMISSNYPPLLGGPASSVPYICEELAKRGFEVHVVTQGDKNYPNMKKESGFTVHRTSDVSGRYYYPHIILRKIFEMSGLSQKIIKDYKIDLIHSHDLNISGVVGCLANKQKLPSICRFGGDLAWEYLSLFNWKEENPEKMLKNGGLAVKFLEYVQKKISDGYDLIAPVSEYQKEWLVRFTKIDECKIVTLKNGVPNLPKSTQEIKNFKKKFGDGFVLSAASRIVPWKGLQYLIKSLKFLPKDVKLAIAGSGPYEQYLLKLTSSLSLGNRVMFLGKVQYESIRNFVFASDVFVLPSLYEPFSIGLIDTLATNTPIIATDVGGTPEAIEHEKNGLLVRPGDAEDLAEKIMMLKGNSKLYKRLIKAQKVLSKEYSWKNRVKDFIKIYDSMI